MPPFRSCELPIPYRALIATIPRKRQYKPSKTRDPDPGANQRGGCHRRPHVAAGSKSPNRRSLTGRIAFILLDYI